MPFRKCTLVPSWFWDTDVLNYVWTSASLADEVVRESWWNPGMILVEIVHESCEVVQPSAEIGWTCAHPRIRLADDFGTEILDRPGVRRRS